MNPLIDKSIRLVSLHALLMIVPLILTQGCRTMEGWHNAREKMISSPSIFGMVQGENKETTKFIIKYSDSFRPYYFGLSFDDVRQISYHGPLKTRREILNEVSNRSTIENFRFDGKSLELGTSIVKSGAFERFDYHRKIDIFKNDPGTSLGGITFIPYWIADKRHGSNGDMWEKYNILMIPSTQSKPDRYRHLDLGTAIVATPVGLLAETVTYVFFVPIAFPIACILKGLGYER